MAAQAATGEPLVVTGPSGSGKSSLLRAGLIASLRRATDAEIILLTPGADPLGALAARLARLDRTYPADLRVWLEKDPAVLRDVVADTLDGRRAVLIVDQFEELFTVCGDERQRQIFIQALHALCGKDAARESARPASAHAVGETDPGPAAVVILGVRADFFGHCTAYPELVPALEQAMVVGPMSPAQLRQAIEGPARRAGLTLEPGLVDLILEDLGTEAEGGETSAGVLPLLSHALLVTWQHREGRTLTLAGYRATGGIHRALARTADATLEELDLGARAIARQMLTRLVRIGDGENDTRRAVPLEELLPGPGSAQYHKARQVLDRFAQARLLTVGAGTVQLAHEALIRAWPQLRQWINTDRSALLVHQELTQDAAEWHRNGRDPAYLYQGSRLAGAQQAVALWRTDPDRYPALPGVARDFLHASEVAAQRRARRRQQSIVALVVSLVLALAGAGAAVKLAADAKAERARSLSRQLAAESENIADVNPRLARRLATTAWDIAHTEEARVSLLKAFLRPERATLTGQTGAVYGLAFSPDGTVLAIADEAAVRLRHTRTGDVITTLTGPTESALSLAFSPDGTHLAIGHDNGTIRIWSTATRTIIATLKAIRIP